MSRLPACAPGWFRCACKPCSVTVHDFCSVHENMRNITASTFLWASGRAVAQADKDEGYDKTTTKPVLCLLTLYTCMQNITLLWALQQAIGLLCGFQEMAGCAMFNTVPTADVLHITLLR